MPKNKTKKMWVNCRMWLLSNEGRRRQADTVTGKKGGANLDF
jgi:hypothetical protein